MISFMDKTFCRSRCSNMECSRRLDRTQPGGDLHERLVEWSKDLPYQPVAVADFTTTCEDWQAIDGDEML